MGRTNAKKTISRRQKVKRPKLSKEGKPVIGEKLQTINRDLKA